MENRRTRPYFSFVTEFSYRTRAPFSLRNGRVRLSHPHSNEVKKAYEVDDPEINRLLKKEVHSKIKEAIGGTILAKVEKDEHGVYKIIDLY